MRYATICVFFALIIHKEAATPDSDFRPIPIPLDQWNYEKREARVGTLHETIDTDKSTTVAAVPAHYWEDALRHSVYLTLVRDKIDQLIAKGVVVSPGAKPNQHTSKEVDDHDLWEKIKKAPFDRLQGDDHATYGDVTIMAKGRLLEENGGFRFTEDERSTEDCKDEKCMKGVKAFWSVKRVRQRDEEISSGKYHYELTFSVNSQPPKKQRKPFETPVRTFTVRENPPDIIMANPKEQGYQSHLVQTPRPQRAIWVHRNIAPLPRPSQPRHQHYSSLDRIFSSFFWDDDSHVEPPPRFRPKPYTPPMYQQSQHSKLGYAGPPHDQQPKKNIQHPYVPNMYNYQRPPLQAPPLNHMKYHYLDIDIDGAPNHPHVPPPLDHRHISPSNIIKTTRPAVLPTPPIPEINTTKNSTNFYTDDIFNDTQITTVQPNIPPTYKSFNKPRPPVKINYFPERIRPPVYNAPPGVFLNMDKKPFKPMPPLKQLHSSKPPRRPVDFRPSPQVLDGSFSDPDTTVDSAFRPILLNYTEKDETDKNKFEVTSDIKHGNKPLRKKPPKKQEIIKTHRVTTSAPDIITVQEDLEEDNDTMQWANILGAFTKTTPIDFYKDKEKTVESTTQPMALTNSTIANKKSTVNNSSKEATTTTAPVKKRTRPPHKFVKTDKTKKHKRITTTTAEAVKAQKTKPSDLSPQASSAPNDGNKSWQPKNKTSTTTSTTSTSTTQKTPSSTATSPITTTAAPPPTTIKAEETTKPEQQKNKNRFRQSTLMLKGTSVKHDRWSANTYGEKKANATTSKNGPRRKGSNFHGYSSTSTPKHSSYEEFTRRYEKEKSKQPESTTMSYRPQSTQPTYEETADHYINSDSTAGYSQNEEEESEYEHDDIEVVLSKDDEHEIEDHSEFIFDLTSKTPNEKSNEIIEEEMIVTEQSVVATSHSVSKNKTKCKKKKHHHLAPTNSSVTEEQPSNTSMATSTKSSSSMDILDDLLGSLTYDGSTAKSTENKHRELEEEESQNHEKYLQIDEDFEDFLDSFEDKHRHRHSDEKEIDDYEDEDVKESSFDDEVSPFDNDDVNEPRKSGDKDYDDEYHERSYSLLELMAME